MSFYRGEALPGPEAVPEALTTPVTPFLLAMQGTLVEPPRCVALEGEIGLACACSIHPQRPSPCREFEASWAGGEHQPRCDQARRRHGLPPLSPEDHPQGAEMAPEDSSAS